jgi:hypothetical protein
VCVLHMHRGVCLGALWSEGPWLVVGTACGLAQTLTAVPFWTFPQVSSVEPCLDASLVPWLL